MSSTKGRSVAFRCNMRSSGYSLRSAPSSSLLLQQFTNRPLLRQRRLSHPWHPLRDFQIRQIPHESPIEGGIACILRNGTAWNPDTSLGLGLRQMRSNGLNLQDCDETHLATFPTSQSTLWRRYPRWRRRVDRFRPSGRGLPIKGRAVGGAAVPEKKVLQGSWIMATVPNSSMRAAKKLAVWAPRWVVVGSHHAAQPLNCVTLRPDTMRWRVSSAIWRLSCESPRG